MPSAGLQVAINGRQVIALIDTGADYSVMSKPFLVQLRKIRTVWDGPQICTAGGHLVTPTGRCTVRVTLHGSAYPVNFVILQQRSRNMILGTDFLGKRSAVIDLKARSLMLTSGQSASLESTGYQHTALTILEDTGSIPPRASVLRSVEMEEKAARYRIVEWNVQLLLDRQISVACGVVHLHRG